jgi:uncharacterized membrane protein
MINEDKSTSRQRQLLAFIASMEPDFYKVYDKKMGRGEAGKRLRKSFRELKDLLDVIRKESLQQTKDKP